MQKIYVGCALTHSSEEYREGINNFKTSLRARGYEVLDFIGLGNGDTPQDVYNYDIGCVEKCDFFIMECTHASLGAGLELGMAIHFGKPILAIAPQDAHVTRIVQGVVADNFRFVRYNTIDEIVELVADILH